MNNTPGYFSRIVAALSPPIFVEDEDKTRLTSILYYTAVLLFITNLIIQSFLRPLESVPLIAVSGAVMRLATCVIVIVLLRKGFYKPAANIFIWALFISFAISEPQGGGVYSLGFRSAYFLLIIVASVLIGYKQAITLTAVIIAYGLILAVYFPSTEFLSIEFFHSPLKVWAAESLLFAVAVIFIRLSFHTVVESLSIARQELTARKRTEASLQTSKENYEEVFNATSEAILILDVNTRLIIDANQTAVKMFGFDSKTDIISKTMDELSAQEGESAESKTNQIFLKSASGQPQVFDWHVKKKNGGPIWVEVSLKESKIGGENKILAVFRDISERRRTEDAVRESERRYRLLSESTFESIGLSADGVLIEANEQLAKMLKYDLSELIGKKVDDFVAPESKDFVNEKMKSGDERPYEHWALCKDGSKVLVEVRGHRTTARGKPVRVTVIRDLTEKKRAEDQKKKLEDQLLQSQKMEAFGRLAGGVAHDFNNMLTPILGYSELLVKTTPPDDPRYNKLQQVIHAAEHSKQLISNLLSFARKQKLEVKKIDLNTVILRFKKILSRTLRENITFKTNLAAVPCTIRGDVSQIEQIILNLSVNAMDAMQDGGDLVIETSIVSEQDMTFMTVNGHGKKSGKYVLLTIRDTGIGLSKDLLPKIFEPFFTTKPEGKGTGLGLSTVYGIVKQHDGFITVDSTEKQGTVFMIYFPFDTGQDVPEELKEGELVDNQRHQGAILVVEDQEQITNLIAEVLSSEGYTIFTSSTVAHAEELFSLYNERIGLCIADIILPDGNGRDLYDVLIQRKPDLRVLFMSSYPEEVVTGKGSLPRDALFISKPFSLSKLVKAVDKLTG